MVPRTILRQLSRLRWRERSLRFTWGAARWLAVVLIVLGLACLTDYLIDRYTETPWPLRYALAAAQLLLACFILAVWVFGPTLRRLSDSLLALWVEDKTPRLSHRLISTVQLNQRGAKTEGMSKELIAAVTQETERQTKGMSFAAVADHRRLSWSAGVTAPVVLAAAALLVLLPEIVQALVARQLLMDVDIPRRYSLVSQTRKVWPAGEEVTLKFLVKGPELGPDVAGNATISPEGQGGEDYPLVYDSPAGDGQAYYTVTLPAPSADFSFRAYVGDARLSQPGYVHFEPRPVITQQEAWVLLRFGNRGARHEKPYPVLLSGTGDIVTMPRQRVLVRVKVQKPIEKGKLELLGSPLPDLSAPLGDSDSQSRGVKTLADNLRDYLGGEVLARAVQNANREERVLRTVPMKVWTDKKGNQYAEAEFELRPTETAHRITVFDEYGFENVPPPVRTLRLVPEEAPQVALLPEIIRDPSDKGFTEDYDQTGMPLPPGQRIQIAYTATGPLSLGRATLYYRVIKKPSEGGGDSPLPTEEDWQTLKLIEEPESLEKGPFDLRSGAFVKSGSEENVGFHVLARGDGMPGKTEGGGRYNFQTSKLTFKSRGQTYVGQELEPGDRIEFYVEVFPDGKYDRETEVAAQRPPGKSEIRGKDIVTVKDWDEARQRRIQQEDRLRELRRQQEKVSPVNSSFLQPGTRPGVRGPLTEIHHLGAFIIARHQVAWEPSWRGDDPCHKFKGGFSC